MKLNKRNSIFKLYFILLSLISSPLFAAEGDNAADEALSAAIKAMLIITILLIVFIMWLVLVYAGKNDTEGDVLLKPFKVVFNYMTNLKPVEEEPCHF